MKKHFLLIVLALSIALNKSSAQSLIYNWAESNITTASSGTNSCVGKSITSNSNGDIYVVGEFHSTVDFDPGTGIQNITSFGNSDVFIQKLDSSGNLIWVKQIGSSSWEHVYDVKLDTSGNIYIVGSFEGSTDFDPGVGVYIISPMGNGANSYILKLNSSGGFIWAKTFGSLSGGLQEANSISIDTPGNITVTGVYSNTVDFDPGPGIQNLSAVSFYDIFILKMDASANLIWVKSVGGNGGGLPSQIKLDNQGNYYIGGKYNSTLDFDPGISVSNSTSLGGFDAFILKLTNNGDFIWVKTIQGTNHLILSSIDIDQNDNIYSTGSVEGVADFDPGVGITNLSSNGSSDIYVLKLNSSGVFVWAKSFGGVGEDVAWGIRTDSEGNIFTTGHFNYTVDFDPGLGVVYKTSYGSRDIFYDKLDSLGNLLWVETIGGNSFDSGLEIDFNSNGDIITTGSCYGSPDFDLGIGSSLLNSGIGGSNCFIAKYRENPCANLSIIVDSIKDISCTSPNGYANAYGIYGALPYSYLWNTTPISSSTNVISGASGLYSLTVTDAIGCETTSSALINAPLYLSNFDLEANLIANNFRVGFSSFLWIDGFNSGCTPVSGQMALIMDPLVTFDSSVVTPSNIIGDTIFWNFNNLQYDSAHVIPTIHYTTSTTASIGDTVCFDLIMNPFSGDVDTSNNKKHYCFPVINGYDPNDKQVYPQGFCPEKYINSGERLTYTIRFQNTGNSDAININVLDTISPYLDINSLSVVGVSHENLITTVIPGNVIKFKFDSIMLPDSSSNQVESHGYVIFEINSLGALPNGTHINNKAEIYFDFNPAVVTNTVSNNIIDIIPCVPVGIEALLNNRNQMFIYPNPTSSQLTIVSNKLNIKEIIIIDVTGKTLKTIRHDTNFINVSNLANGIYYIKVITDEDIVTKKFIKQ